jgi:hypothetical protein
MEVQGRKVLCNIFYYSMAFLVLLFTILFMILLSNIAVATYQMVIYMIWSAALIILLIADVIATMMNRFKFVIGLLIYGLAFIYLVVAFIIYAAMNVGGLIPATAIDAFSVLVYFPLALTIGLFIVYFAGNKRAEERDDVA